MWKMPGERRTQYVATGSLPIEITKRDTTHWPGLVIGNFENFMIAHMVASVTNVIMGFYHTKR